jgi:TonB family protein
MNTRIKLRIPASLLPAGLLIFAIVSVVSAQNHESHREFALLPESWARKSAVNMILPIYPEECERLGISGVVRVRFETSASGEVLRIKVQPHTESPLKKAVVNAVKYWRFKPWLGLYRLEVPVISRLTFNFVIEKGKPQVELYNPGAHVKGGTCLACSNSHQEMIEWQEWDDAWSKREPAESYLHPSNKVTNELLLNDQAR